MRVYMDLIVAEAAQVLRRAREQNTNVHEQQYNFSQMGKCVKVITSQFFNQRRKRYQGGINR